MLCGTEMIARLSDSMLTSIHKVWSGNSTYRPGGFLKRRQDGTDKDAILQIPKLDEFLPPCRPDGPHGALGHP